MFARSLRRRWLVGLTALAAIGGVAGLGPAIGGASSHREAPLTAADPQIDTTDVYAFMSSPDKVTLIAGWIPFEEPAGGPNFYLWGPGVRYVINIDNDGDAKADISYRWVFTTHYRSKNTFLYNTGPVTSLDDHDLNIYQTYSLTRFDHDRGTSKTLVRNAIAAPSNVGKASMPSYNKDLFDAAVTTFGGGAGKTWVGQADDPFFLDLRVFDLLYGADLSETGDDTLSGFNVNALAIQVPPSDLAKNGNATKNPIVGIWSTTSRHSLRVQDEQGNVDQRGPFVQVSRLGNPLVNEVVIPVGLKDRFNGSKPSGDAQFLPFVEDPEVPHLLHAIYDTEVPDTDANKPGVQRDDLVQVFLTGVPGLNQPKNVTPSEMVRLNMSIPPCTSDCSTLGVVGGDTAGFPNGRRLSDDVIDEALRVMLGVLLPDHQALADTIGDGVDANDVPFTDTFPFLAYPHAGSDPSPHA
ncbi:MAG TPA: DUF4331 domain-containing protein [Actinomycetota bacterium]|jgi:hypothetical protein|nr:DUF4331 domain-containing protein [Actinomycetota bacterium]